LDNSGQVQEGISRLRISRGEEVHRFLERRVAVFGALS